MKNEWKLEQAPHVLPDTGGDEGMIYILFAQSIQLCVSNMNPLKQEKVYVLNSVFQ